MRPFASLCARNARGTSTAPYLHRRGIWRVWHFLPRSPTYIGDGMDRRLSVKFSRYLHACATLHLRAGVGRRPTSRRPRRSSIRCRPVESTSEGVGRGMNLRSSPTSDLRSTMEARIVGAPRGLSSHERGFIGHATGPIGQRPPLVGDEGGLSGHARGFVGHATPRRSHGRGRLTDGRGFIGHATPRRSHERGRLAPRSGRILNRGCRPSHGTAERSSRISRTAGASR